jgi:hypothetical protein
LSIKSQPRILSTESSIPFAHHMHDDICESLSAYWTAHSGEAKLPQGSIKMTYGAYPCSHEQLAMEISFSSPSDTASQPALVYTLTRYYNIDRLGAYAAHIGTLQLDTATANFAFSHKMIPWVDELTSLDRIVLSRVGKTPEQETLAHKAFAKWLQKRMTTAGAVNTVELRDCAEGLRETLVPTLVHLGGPGGVTPLKSIAWSISRDPCSVPLGNEVTATWAATGPGPMAYGLCLFLIPCLLMMIYE